MKKELLIIIILLAAKAVSGQVLIALLFGDKLNGEKLEFGLDLGVNRSNIINLEPSQAAYGFNLGMTFVYKFGDKLLLNPSIYYTFPGGVEGMQGYTTPDSNLNAVVKTANVKRELSYLSLPILVRYSLFGLTYLELGPQFNYLTKARDYFTVSLFNDDDITYTSYIDNKYHNFDVGVAIGIAQRLKKDKGVTLKLRYYNSLMNISNDANSKEQYNSVFYFSATIPIGEAK